MCVELQLLWEGAVVIPVIMEIHTDFLCPFQTPDRTLTRRNQMLRDDDIFSKVEQKKKQNGRLLSFLFTFDPDTWQTNTVIFSEFNWKIVFSKITSRISKPLSVFDKLGFASWLIRGDEFLFLYHFFMISLFISFFIFFVTLCYFVIINFYKNFCYYYHFI